MPVTLSAEVIGPENEETVAARDLTGWKCRVTSDKTDAKGQRQIVGVVEGRSSSEVTLDQDDRIVAGKCGCSYFYTGGLRKGPCRHLQALRNKALGFGDQGGTLDSPLADVMVQQREGGFGAIGVESWAYATDAEIGRWSPLIETVGAFELVRVDERSAAASPRDLRFKTTICVIPYVDADDPRGIIEAKLDHSKLEFVDPSWSDIVPEFWKHRLRGGSP